MFTLSCEIVFFPNIYMHVNEHHILALGKFINYPFYMKPLHPIILLIIEIKYLFFSFICPAINSTFSSIDFRIYHSKRIHVYYNIKKKHAMKCINVHKTLNFVNREGMWEVYARDGSKRSVESNRKCWTPRWHLLSWGIVLDWRESSFIGNYLLNHCQFWAKHEI